MAGAAATNASAIVLEVDIIVQSHIQHRFALGGHVGLVGLAVLKLKGNVNGFHGVTLGERGKNAGAKVRTLPPESKLYLSGIVCRARCGCFLNANCQGLVDGLPFRMRR